MPRLCRHHPPAGTLGIAQRTLDLLLRMLRPRHVDTIQHPRDICPMPSPETAQTWSLTPRSRSDEVPPALRLTAMQERDDRIPEGRCRGRGRRQRRARGRACGSRGGRRRAAAGGRAGSGTRRQQQLHRRRHAGGLRRQRRAARADARPFGARAGGDRLRRLHGGRLLRRHGAAQPRPRRPRPGGAARHPQPCHPALAARERRALPAQLWPPGLQERRALPLLGRARRRGLGRRAGARRGALRGCGKGGRRPPLRGAGAGPAHRRWRRHRR